MSIKVQAKPSVLVPPCYVVMDQARLGTCRQCLTPIGFTRDRQHLDQHSTSIIGFHTFTSRSMSLLESTRLAIYRFGHGGHCQYQMICDWPAEMPMPAWRNARPIKSTYRAPKDRSPSHVSIILQGLYSSKKLSTIARMASGAWLLRTPPSLSSIASRQVLAQLESHAR